MYTWLESLDPVQLTEGFNVDDVVQHPESPPGEVSALDPEGQVTLFPPVSQSK